MSCKVCPDYAKDYKNEFLFVRGIDKCFEYYLNNLNKATSGVFQNRIERINKYLDRLRLPNTLEIDERDVGISLSLIEGLAEFTDYYVNDRWEFDQEAFVNNVDGDFPGWFCLVETIELFHSKFVMVNKYYPPIEIIYDSDESDDS